MQKNGLIAIVKRDCPTCVMVTPVLQEILQTNDLKIYSQDDPEFPDGGDISVCICTGLVLRVISDGDTDIYAGEEDVAVVFEPRLFDLV